MKYLKSTVSKIFVTFNYWVKLYNMFYVYIEYMYNLITTT